MQSPPVTHVSPTRPSLRSSLSLQRPRLPQLATQQQRRRQACALAQVDANGAGAVAQRPESARSSRPHATSSADEDAARSAMTGTLLVKCPDAKGVVASVAQVREVPLQQCGAPTLSPPGSSPAYSTSRSVTFYQRAHGCLRSLDNALRWCSLTATPASPAPLAASLWPWVQHSEFRPVFGRGGRHVLPARRV
jgi:hypothetical protein